MAFLALALSSDVTIACRSLAAHRQLLAERELVRFPHETEHHLEFNIVMRGIDHEDRCRQ